MFSEKRKFLIPEEMRSFVKPTKQIENFWKFFICSIIIVGIFYGGLHLYKLNINKQFQNVQNQMKKINDELVNYSEFKEKEQSTQMRIKVTQKLIDNHIYATNILSFLEDNTLKDIIYTNLDFNSTLSQNNKTESITKINIEGVSKDFATIKNQLLIFQNVANFVKKVEISELLSTKEQKKKKEFKGLDGIGFKMDIELQPGILQKTF